MKALTLWQPWASLIAWGEKRYETRSWTTSHRGLLAIHAAVPQPQVWRRLTENKHLWRVLEQHQTLSHDLPTTAVLCIVQLVDVVSAAEIAHNLTDKEKAFGDFGWGRFAWRLKVVERFKQPQPTRGHQGLWTWEG